MDLTNVSRINKVSLVKVSYLYSSSQTEFIDEQFFEFVIDILSLQSPRSED